MGKVKVTVQPSESPPGSPLPSGSPPPRKTEIQGEKDYIRNQFEILEKSPIYMIYKNGKTPEEIAKNKSATEKYSSDSDLRDRTLQEDKSCWSSKSLILIQG